MSHYTKQKNKHFFYVHIKCVQQLSEGQIEYQRGWGGDIGVGLSILETAAICCHSPAQLSLGLV